MKRNVGLVLEGGAMRGMFTAGVLDVLMENNIEVDGIIGVSAGALFGPNYFSKQKGRALRYNKRFCNDKRYISKRSLFLTGNIVNKNFAFYKITKELDSFDDQTFMKSKKDFYVVITNIETGKAEYKKIKSILTDMEILRASSAMPITSKVVKIDNKKYLDGAIGDSIPVNKFRNLGYKKIIVILTQPYDYRKKPLSSKQEKLVRTRFKKYPEFTEALLNRYNNYNNTLEEIIDLETKQEIFVIRPNKKLDINVIERDKEKIQEVYDVGVEVAKNILTDLKEYLKK